MRFAKLVMVVAVVALGGVSAGYGSTFVLMSETDLAARSVAAVTGWVTAIEAAADPTTGGVNTYIHIEPDEVIFGNLPTGDIVLRETGGRLRGESEWLFGSPEYRVGQEVLVFLAQNDDGTLRTTAMAMGKFDVEHDRRGTATAVRRLGEGVALWNPRTRQLETEPDDEVYDLEPLKAAVRQTAPPPDFTRSTRRSRLRTVPPELSRSTDREAQASFTYLSSPSRWFEPDDGQPVAYMIDPAGDVGVGAANTRAAMNDAFAAWTNVPTSPLTLTDGGDLPAPVTFAGCTGGNRIVFNDPFNEVSDPTGCTGVLAIGGYCASSETRTVGGTNFRRIRVGKITFNNGWSSCGGWNRCNMAEVATHEIGHTLGFGHSTDFTATMYASAHFDGRCANLRSDDLAGLNFVYPGGAAPTVGPPTATPSYTFTATRTLPPATPTWTRTPSATRTFTPTPTAAPTSPPATITATRTVTPTRTVPPTATASATSPIPFTSTPTSIPSSTATSGPRRRVRGRVQYYRADRAVPGVTVNLQGVSPDATLTADTGAYEFNGVTDGSWELGAAKVSDFGTGVSPLDAAYVLQSVANLRNLDATQQLACDVTGDGSLSTVDAARILQFSVGTLRRLPVASICDSDWLFMPVPAPMQQQSVINPEVSSGICHGGRIMLDDLLEDIDGQDFHAALFGDCTGNWQSAVEQAAVVRSPGRAPQLRLGRLMVEDGQARLPVYVRSGTPYHALDLMLSYDPTRLTPTGAQLRKSAASGITSYNAPTPGVMRVAMASGEPIKRRHGVLLVLNFAVAGAGDMGDIRAMHASVDERAAVIAAGDAP